MAKYTVIGNVKRKGKLLPRDVAADFDPKEAEPLVARGYLVPVVDKAPAKNTAGDDDKGAAGKNGNKGAAGSKPAGNAA